MDWVAFARAAIPYIPEARRRHPKAAPKPEPQHKKFATDLCPQGHTNWYHYINRFGYECRYCRDCRKAKREARKWR